MARQPLMHSFTRHGSTPDLQNLEAGSFQQKLNQTQA
jgi:hypothetical protein